MRKEGNKLIEERQLLPTRDRDSGFLSTVSRILWEGFQKLKSPSGLSVAFLDKNGNVAQVLIVKLKDRQILQGLCAKLRSPSCMFVPSVNILPCSL